MLFLSEEGLCYRHGNARERLDSFTLQHNITVDEVVELTEHEAERATKAAAYLDRHAPTGQWSYTDQLEIARCMAAGASEGDFSGDRLVIALQDQIRAKANEAVRTIHTQRGRH
jgi:hypothetical protein